MEGHHPVLPLSLCPSQHTSLVNSRPRLPLTDSTGNAQYHTVASTDIYNDPKGVRPRLPLNFTLPTLPSQPVRQYPQRTALEARRSHIRSQRTQRNSRYNPVLESENYQSYRSRQPKLNDDGKDDRDQRWPDDLEDLFLEALCLLPQMGRRKFSINGKPNGRNELISMYLWMGHCASIPQGTKPDETKRRTRKQVSSHIQVLKGFMRGHPSFERLFPPKNDKENFLEDSFKNDTCLRALAQGRLPHRRSNNFFSLPTDNQPQTSLVQLAKKPAPSRDRFGRSSNQPSSALRPALFKMYMTTLQPGVDYKDVPEDDIGDGKLSTKVHTYSDSVPRHLGHSTLESLPNWETKFPKLAQLQACNDLTCDIIHTEATLELRYGSLPDRSELWGKFEILVHGNQNSQNSWRCVQSLHKPADLCGPLSTDPPYEKITSSLQTVRYDPLEGVYLRVSFPASPWAHALQRLSTMEAQYEEAVQIGAPIPIPITARQYIDQITMFQEIFCSDGPDQPFIRSAIMLWTFKKCKSGEQGQATWRYLTPPPSRSVCFSPHPENYHVASAAMAGNFSAWADGLSPSMHIPSALNPFDSLSRFEDHLSQLPSVGGPNGVNFPFVPYSYPPTENLSFVSHESQDSDRTLVNGNNNGVSSFNGFLSNTGVLGSFDHSQLMWEGPVQSFDPNATSFLTNYEAVHSNNTSQGWDGADPKSGDWDMNIGNTSFPAGVFDAPLSQE